METHIRTIQTYYHAEQNKKMIYYGVIGLFVFTLALRDALLAIFATSNTLYYMSFIFTLPLIYGATHWMLICSMAKPTSSIYSVASERDLGDEV